jgi:hypothetical protein
MSTIPAGRPCPGSFRLLAPPLTISRRSRAGRPALPHTADSLEILVDTRERCPYRFAGKQAAPPGVRCRRHYAVEAGVSCSPWSIKVIDEVLR